jgi:hypothetical protein
MGWTLLLLGLIFAPIVWGLTKGRYVRDVTEDHEGVSGYGNLIKHRDFPAPHGGGGSGGTSS